jgi:predicted DNA-binding transcriptional regulator YafY
MNNTAYQSLNMTRADFKVAIAFRKPVHIHYVADNGDVSNRVIEPHELRETQDGSVLVVAMCRLKGERRHFRLDRVSHYMSWRPGFELELPSANPEEITDWWTLRSSNDHEVLQLELNTDGVVNPYAMVLKAAQEQSGKVRAVVKAERGITIRRLRRKDVLSRR